MAGLQMRVMEKTTLTYASNSLTTGTVLVVAALNVDVVRYREVIALLRVHAFTGGAGASITANVYPSAPTNEDPALIFRGGTALMSPTVAYTGSTFPKLAVDSAAAEIPGNVDIILTIAQATSATDLTIVVSLDLVGKE